MIRIPSIWIAWYRIPRHRLWNIGYRREHRVFHVGIAGLGGLSIGMGE